MQRFCRTACFAIFLTLLSLLPAAGASSAEDAPGRSKIRVVNDTFDFGAVQQGTKVVNDFIIRNEGSADLVIQRVVAACGCTAASASSEAISPGAEGRIHVEFDTTGFSGDKLKTVRVYSNDAENGMVLLTIKGVIEPDVTIEPRSLFFEEVVRGGADQPAPQAVNVRVRPGSAVKIGAIKSFSKYLVLKELERSDKFCKFSVGVDPEAPFGELRERVVVSLTGARETSVNVPVYAVVKRQLRVNPTQLSFGLLEGPAEISRAARLDNFGRRPVSILALRSNHAAVRAEYKVIEQGKKYVIQVHVDPKKAASDLRAVLEIITDSVDDPTISLNVYGIVSGR